MLQTSFCAACGARPSRDRSGLRCSVLSRGAGRGAVRVPCAGARGGVRSRLDARAVDNTHDTHHSVDGMGGQCVLRADWCFSVGRKRGGATLQGGGGGSGR